MSTKNENAYSNNMINKDEFLDLYCNKNKSIAYIATHFGISRKSVFKYAKLFGVKKTPEQLSALKKEGCKKRDYKSSLAKRITTVKKKYGVTNISQLSSVKKKKEETTFKHYGVKHTVSRPEIISKRKQACIDKYGVESVFLRRDVIEDIFVKKYGVTNPGLLPDHRDKVTKTCLEKYGVPFSGQAEEVKENIRNTCITKYGVDSASKVPDIQQKAHNALYKSGMGRSSFEKEVCAYLDSIGVTPYETNVYKATTNELDIYSKEKAIAIECNGDYWHSSKNKPSNYHYNKTQFCIQNNIDLLHIFECEWKNKKDIVKSIIAARFGIFTTKYRADKGFVTKEKYTKEIKSFFDDNHIQGAYSHGVFCYCLRDKKTKELMACMLFSKDTRNNKYQIILSRFCSKINYNIPFAATKLFTHFLRDNTDIKEVCSYSDRRIFNGGLYKKLGFSKVDSTRFDYFYIVDGKIHNKSYGMKANLKRLYPNLDISNKTEAELTDSLGWLKVYDSGKDVWVYTV